MSFDVVVAADLDWGIGRSEGPLPWPRLRGDLAHFKRTTSTASAGRRNAVVMGRKTWDSPEVAGKPLPNRLNIIVSRRALAVPDGVLAVTSLDAALAGAQADVSVETIFVVGGGEIFRHAFADPRLGRVYLTRIEGRFGCDITIPDLDQRGFVLDDWQGACVGEDNNVRYRIERLRQP